MTASPPGSGISAAPVDPVSSTRPVHIPWSARIGVGFMLAIGSVLVVAGVACVATCGLLMVVTIRVAADHDVVRPMLAIVALMLAGLTAWRSRRWRPSALILAGFAAMMCIVFAATLGIESGIGLVVTFVLANIFVPAAVGVLRTASGEFDPATWRRRHLRSGRCPYCGYELHGTTLPRCPECGGAWSPSDRFPAVGDPSPARGASTSPAG